MKNPKTTLGGYMTLASVLATLAYKFWSGDVSTEDVSLLFPTLAGIGLIGAKDGGH